VNAVEVHTGVSVRCFQIRAKGPGSFIDNVGLKTPGLFSSPVGLLPPQIWPKVVEPQHENCILDRLPATQISAPSLEFIQHYGSTRTPGIVAEGTTKSEITFQTQKIVAPALKIASHIAVSWESLAGVNRPGRWRGHDGDNQKTPSCVQRRHHPH
jgi:hypothetical protein